jgi:hypothetical protein
MPLPNPYAVRACGITTGARRKGSLATRTNSFRALAPARFIRSQLGLSNRRTKAKCSGTSPKSLTFAGMISPEQDGYGEMSKPISTVVENWCQAVKSRGSSSRDGGAEVGTVPLGLVVGRS